ncbi:MAG: family 10 glycosylhydrolase [Lentisphaerae bacterium]|jgi:hypothetical protein|nr:family 10 glycosylhydrolase [Lentisphaerota bacterium]MBT4814963.1 family 10 glycosylhydrolase [Lentisphaerota bacterium]MBT5607014.1 family 10 glycosylhydrolase [Lentisphaerota bacterium]MBT7059715.1 family 10 glycosylhydrolase [Lentisphaerota bacterium]MBT7843292.1 family 10 glycosylhydrolase [Lentisphaerota bacterium]
MPYSPRAERSVCSRLTPSHVAACERPRRIILQEDANMPMEALGIDFDEWIAFRFQHCDAPGSQIDGIWWDIGFAEDTYAVYESKLLPRLTHPGLQRWWSQGIDWVERLVSESHARGLEAFWNNRVCPVDFAPTGPAPIPHDDPRRRNPLKQQHPDWTVPCWWPQGLWNLANPEVQERKVAILRELLERYALDGIQLDFARHTPCLPAGREWELRGQVTAFVSKVRDMMLDIEAATGQPRLLSVRVGETIEGNHRDGFEVENWIAAELVDILNLGGRTTTVDVAAFEELTRQTPVRLCAPFDGHHTTDGYYFPEAAYLRGVFTNFLHQGVDFVSLFNWACASGEWYDRLGLPPMMKCPQHVQATREVGSLGAMADGSRTYAVERKGGYPWAQNYLYRNDDRPLPAALPAGGSHLELPLYIYEDATARMADWDVDLRLVVRANSVLPPLEVRLNGHCLPELRRDSNWHDGQIYGDHPQPSSGSHTSYDHAFPDVKLTMVEFAASASQFVRGQNCLAIARSDHSAGDLMLEKVEGRFAPAG